MRKIKSIKSLSMCLTLFMLVGMLTPTSVVKAIDLDESTKGINYKYLSDLNWESAKVGWSNPVKDYGLEGKPLQLIVNDNGDAKIYEKGILVHTDSEVIYNIEGKNYSRFISDIGVNYGVSNDPNKGHCDFEVWIDDTKVVDIDGLHGTKKMKTIDVEIPEEAKQLKLITTQGNDGKNYDHSIWADAKLYIDEEHLEDLSYFSVNPTSAILDVNGQIQLTMEALLANGDALKIPSNDVNIDFNSSNDSIASVDENGIITGISDGRAKINCTITYRGISLERNVEIIVGQGEENSTWNIVSPDKSQRLIFMQNENGSMSFTASKDGKMIIENSPLGLITNLGDFTTDLIYYDSIQREINESYELIGAKKKQVNSQANEITLTFTKENLKNVKFSIIARVYDDGFAFRYGIEGPDGTKLTISDENTGFKLSNGTISQAMPYISHHENVAFEKNIEDLSGNYSMPFLFETPDGIWGLISEAELSSSYCGAIIKGNPNGMLDVEFTPEQTTEIVTTAPFESPWRFLVSGNTEDIALNTMAENLSKPTEIEDTSWIKPGVTSWTWLNRESTSDFETYKRYVDLSAEMGWEYLLLDDGWQPAPGKYYSWTQELLDYANSKGVGLIAWIDHKYVDTPEEQKILKEWADMGFKGIKPDFFNSQSQKTMLLTEQLAKVTAENKLLLNMHGANKTTGERRTYPQMLTREGVFGAEQSLFARELVSAKHNCMLPFTRNAVGPADYTPMLGYGTPGSTTEFTSSHMAALPIVYESGIQCFSDRDYVYYESNAYGLLNNFPTEWDESKLIEGIPGEYVNMARRSGEDWYVGIICNTQRTAEFSLDFLGEGIYYATIYKDGENPADIDVEAKVVTKNDTLSIPLVATGGASVKITREGKDGTITLDKESVTMKCYDKVKLNATITPVSAINTRTKWVSSDESIVTVENGVINSLKPGKATITAISGVNDILKASCEVTVLPPEYTLEDRWTIKNPDFSKIEINNENEITIITQPGEFYSPGNQANAKNVLLTAATDKDFSISSKLSFEPDSNYQSAGLLLYLNDRNMFGVFRRSHSGFGGRVLATVNMEGSSLKEETVSDNLVGKDIYVKIEKKGNTLKGFYSVDNKNWIQIGGSQQNLIITGDEDLQIGIYAVNGTNKPGAIPAKFTNLEYEADGQSSEVINFGKRTPVDKTELKNIIDSAKNIKENQYTPSSYSKLQEAIKIAESVYNSEEATIDEVCEAISLIQVSFSNLVARANKDLLNEVINKAEEINKDEYTEESYSILMDILEEAKKIAKDFEVSQEEVDEVKIKLQTAMDSLVEKEKVFKLHLKIAIEEAKKITDKELSNIVPAVVEEFKAALVEAEAILSNPEATRDEVDKSFDRLSNVMHMLSFEKGDKNRLISLIEKISKLNEEEYFSETWNNLQGKLDIAKKVVADQNALVGEITKSYEDLLKEFLQLRLKPSKDKLEELIQQCQGINRSRYTEKTLEALDKVLFSAKKVFNDEEATIESIAQAERDLAVALSGLVEKDKNQDKPSNKNTTNTGNNTSVGKLPNTGGTSSATIALTGLIIAMSGSVVSKKRNKNRK